MRQEPQVTHELKETRSGWNYLEIQSQTLVSLPAPTKVSGWYENKFSVWLQAELTEETFPSTPASTPSHCLCLGARALEPTSGPGCSVESQVFDFKRGRPVVKA